LLDFALLTDGLRAEREQGITIDVAYRYFSTPKRKFIIADTPGHEQYTRNMATGASTATLAVILVDARLGVLPQSRRHAYIASLLGIPHLVIAVNKMDLVDFRRDIFDRIRSEFGEFLGKLGVKDAHFIPISALHGDNVAVRSRRMSWFEGECLLEYLENVPIARDRNLADLRFPVQYVIRPNLNFRGYAGQVVSGVVKPGDSVLALGSERTSRVKSIVTYDGDLPQAYPPMSVTICLEGELDISRGDMLVDPANVPHVSGRLEATLVWMHEMPLEPGRPYLVKHSTKMVRGTVTQIRYRADVNTLERQPAGRLQLNEIGVIALETQRPLYFDPYARNRFTGSFILIDPITNATVGAGMILGPSEARRAAGRVTAEERQSRSGHRPAIVSVNDAELAAHLERALFEQGCMVTVNQSATDETVRALYDTGFIVIRQETSQALAGCTFVSGEDFTDSPDAVEELQQRLREAGVLTAKS